MKKKWVLVGFAVVIIGLVSISYPLFKPSEVSATSCASTCSQTYNSAMISCKAQCSEYYPSTSPTLDACKSGCAFYMTTIYSCSGQVVNTLP